MKTVPKKAMILAAGFGTRLQPITAEIPKALVEVNGTPMLELLLNRLIRAGFTQIAVNGHYKATHLRNFLTDFPRPENVHIHFSYEREILNTGGGIKKMLEFLTGDEPIIVHNVDILCELPFEELLTFHIKENAQCTLVVNKKPSSHPLTFDRQMNFRGRGQNSMPKEVLYNFCGIQVIQPSLFSNAQDTVFYSIDHYIEAANRGEKIVGFNIGSRYWLDIGSLQDLRRAELDIKRGIFALIDAENEQDRRL